MTPVTLHTTRLVLRPWLDSDRQPFAALNADPEVMRYFPAPLLREESDAMADRIVLLMERQGWGFWAVERTPDKSFMGFVGLHQPEDLPFSPCTEVGWRLARPYWGCGYATEAARASLSFAFGQLGLSSVVAFTAAGNTRSQGVMRRLGMTLESPFDHPRLPDAHPLRPHVLYRITHDRFAR